MANNNVPANKFAQFDPSPVKVKPSVIRYQVPPDLKNVLNRDTFDLAITQVSALVENGFVAVPRFHKQLFSVYVENKEKGYPSFVTSDLLLHTYHVMYDDTLKRLEEPVPEFYSRLAALVRMTWHGLERRGLFSRLKPGPEPQREGNTDSDWDAYMEKWQQWEQEGKHAQKEDYQELEDILLRLKEISEKELENRPLSGEEYDFIKDIGYTLARLNFHPRDAPLHRVEDMSLVADIHTDNLSQEECLEVAVGRALELYVVVKIEGALRIARGSIYSYYEFSWPADDRMTDSRWREQLEASMPPPRPVWTNSFIKGGSRGD